MSKKHFFHSSFTPSDAQPKTLETMLVGRMGIAKRLVERIRESATTAEKHQDLLIGPRGIGKTHLLSLVRHRVKAKNELQNKLAIAWLPEDPYVNCYTDLLKEILCVLRDEYPSENLNQDILIAQAQHDPDSLETALEQTLLQWLNDRTLLILMENLDNLFSDIRESGQEKLRALIQNTAQITIVATSASLFAAIAQRNKIFFGFFRQTELQPLNVHEAHKLLVQLAKLGEHTELENQLHLPLSLARVRAMHMLAGGSPRVCTLFYEFLTCESIDTLLIPFKQLVDKLMPYYQGLMRGLSPQQRRIIEAFCRAEGACNASILADELNLKPHTVSTQIRRLRELGYLTPANDTGRSTLFELREPLMRYTIQSKRDRGKYLKYLIEFLRLWYSPRELKEYADKSSSEEEKRYLHEAAQRSNRDGDPIVMILNRDFTSASLLGNQEAALQALETRLATNKNDIDTLKTKAQLLVSKDTEEALQCLIQVTNLDPSRIEAWVELARVYFSIDKIEEAVKAMNCAVEKNPENLENRRLLAWYLRQNGKELEARRIYTQIVRTGNGLKTAKDWDQKGTDLFNAGQYAEALRAYLSAVELQPENSELWKHILGLLQKHFWRADLCLKLSEVATKLIPENLDLRILYAISLSINDRKEESLKIYDSIVTQDEFFEQNSNDLKLGKARILMHLGRSKTALNYLEKTAKPNLEYDNIIRYESTKASLYAALGDWKNFQAVTAQLLKKQPILPDWILASPLDAIEVTPRSNWRESASQWINAFSKCPQLALLATKISADAHFFVSRRVEPTIAKLWLEEFQAEAKPHIELRPAIRTLTFVLSYLQDPEPTRILSLSKEARILVEPGLAESQADQPTDLDKRIEFFIERLKIRVKCINEEQERKAYWNRPAPSYASALKNLKILPKESKKAALAKTLLYSNWVDVLNDAAKILLRKFMQEDENFLKIIARPNLTVAQVRERAMIGSALKLYQIDIHEYGRYGAVDVLHANDKTVLLDGESSVLHQLVRDQTIKTDSPKERDEFLALFCSAIRSKESSEESRFPLLFPDDLHQFDESIWEGDRNSLAIQRTQELDDRATEYRALIQYSDHLFKANLRLLKPGMSTVEMLDNKPVKKMNFVEEIFDGPIRWVWRKPKQSNQSA